MKFNWGTGIFIFIGFFILSGVAFIIFAYNQNINLVHDNYYEKGLNYSQRMEAGERAAKYKNDIEVSNNEEFVIVKFSEQLAKTLENGELVFFRSSDKKRDIKLKLKPFEKGLHVPLGDFINGKYIVQIKWTFKDEDYYLEKDCYINK